MAATMRILSSLVFIAYIWSSTRASPVDQGSQLKLQFNSQVQPDLDRTVFGDEAFAYASWDLQNTTHSNCAVVLTRFDKNGVTSNKSCNVHFNHGQSESFVQGLTSYSLYGNKVVFAYLSVKPNKGYHNYKIVHMETCESYHGQVETVGLLPLQIFLDTARVQIFHREDGTFEGFFPHIPCDGSRCRYIFNDKAQMISGPVPFLPKAYKKSVLVVFASTRSSKYFVMSSDWKVRGFNTEEHTFDMVGTFKVLNVHGQNVNELMSFQAVGDAEDGVFNNLNGFFTFCRMYHINNRKDIHCMQFSDNAVEFNLSSTAGYSDKFIAAYNLPTGGLILAKGNCNEAVCKGMSFEKWSRDVKAKMLHSFEDYEYKYPNDKAILSIGKDNDLCISMYSNQHFSDVIDFTKRCFPKGIVSL